MTIKTIRNKLIKNQLLIRLFVGLMIVIAILVPVQFCLKFLLLFVSGIISGINYGFNNDLIWESPQILIDESRKIVKKDNPEYKENLYVAHQVWIHLLCGIIGSITLYVLLFRMSHYYFWIKNIDGTELILLVISLLGYTGLLPKLLWFFARKGDIKGP